MEELTIGKEKEKTEEQTQAQKIRSRIKELKELEGIEKKLAKNASEKQKLLAKKQELEKKYNL